MVQLTTNFTAPMVRAGQRCGAREAQDYATARLRNPAVATAGATCRPQSFPNWLSIDHREPGRDVTWMRNGTLGSSVD